MDGEEGLSPPKLSIQICPSQETGGGGGGSHGAHSRHLLRLFGSLLEPQFPLDAPYIRAVNFFIFLYIFYILTCIFSFAPHHGRVDSSVSYLSCRYPAVNKEDAFTSVEHLKTSVNTRRVKCVKETRPCRISRASASDVLNRLPSPKRTFILSIFAFMLSDIAALISFFNFSIILGVGGTSLKKAM